MTLVDPAFGEVDDPPRYYRVEIPLVGKQWITANKRVVWQARNRLTRDWRDVAAWRSRHLPTLPRSRVIAELRFANKIRRDPANYSLTAKAVIDGFVDSMVWPDDNNAYVVGPDMRLGAVVAKDKQALVMHIFPEVDGG